MIECLKLIDKLNEVHEYKHCSIMIKDSDVLICLFFNYYI